MTMNRVGHVYIADTARVRGDVTLGEDVNLWYGVVIRGDVAPVTIGARTNVQDAVIIHCDADIPNIIGCDVSIGHGAIVHGGFVGDGTLIASAATVLAESRIGKGCLIAAGAVVPPRMIVPDGMVVMGVPGKIVRAVRDSERAYLAEIPPRYVLLARRHHERPDAPQTRNYDGTEPR